MLLPSTLTVFSSLNSNRTLPLGPPPGSHPTWKSLKVLAPTCIQVPMHTPGVKFGVSISSPSRCHCAYVSNGGMKSLTKWLCHKPTIGSSAWAAGDNAKQPSTSRIVPNVTFNFLIFDFLLFAVWAFFDFSPRGISFGRSLVYCAQSERLLRGKLRNYDWCCKAGSVSGQA